MPPGFDALDLKIDQIMDRLTRIETLVETEGLRCPYRPEIARAANNIVRLKETEIKIDQLQGAIHAIQLKVASWAGVAAIAGVAISEFAKWAFS